MALEFNRIYLASLPCPPYLEYPTPPSHYHNNLVFFPSSQIISYLSIRVGIKALLFATYLQHPKKCLTHGRFLNEDFLMNK